MNLQEALSYSKVNQYFLNYRSGFSNLLSDLGINLDLSTQLYKKNNINHRLKEHMMYEFSVDDHTGFINLYTFDDKVFAVSKSVHEDCIGYDISDKVVFQQVVEFAMSCVEEVKPKEFEESASLELDYPILQMFDSPYNICGQNLLYLEDDGSFTLIEKYWQDRVELEKDYSENRKYDDMYKYKSYEIITDGKQRTVHARHIVGVIGDNKELAELVSKTMNFKESDEFKRLMKSNEVIDLAD